MTKQCKICERYLPKESFHKNTKSKDKLHLYCKECANERTRAWNAAEKERRSNALARPADNPPSLSCGAKKRHFFRDPKHYVIGRERLWRKFGILKDGRPFLWEHYIELLEKQNGRCWICGEPNKYNKSLFVDHDHTTGEARGLLCRPCNTAIGCLLDNPSLCEAVVIYLRHFIRQVTIV